MGRLRGRSAAFSGSFSPGSSSATPRYCSRTPFRTSSRTSRSSRLPPPARWPTRRCSPTMRRASRRSWPSRSARPASSPAAASATPPSRWSSRSRRPRPSSPISRPRLEEGAQELPGDGAGLPRPGAPLQRRGARAGRAHGGAPARPRPPHRQRRARPDLPLRLLQGPREGPTVHPPGLLRGRGRWRLRVQ